MITQLYISVAIGFYLLLTVRIFGIRGNPIFWWLSYGKENQETVNRVVRGHANFVEYAPLFFIMLFILEHVGTPAISLHFLAITFLLGRISHGLLFSFLTYKSIALRTIGMLGTLIALFLAAFINAIQYIASFNWAFANTILSALP